MRKAILSTLAGLGLLAGVAGSAHAAGPTEALPDVSFSHEGVFGSYDRAAAQRGFQVFEQVCSACHSAKYLTFRNLADLGYNEDEIKAIAAKKQVEDGPDENGDMFQRPAAASDAWPSPYANDNQARASNGGALPPDLSLLAKARLGGEHYIYALLTGYHEAPAGVEVRPGLYYNKYFPGHMIGMPPPLANDMVPYGDNTPATVQQMSHDVSVFLTWLAEPKMEERKQMGIKSILFLLALTILFYVVKRRIWARIH
ncbi:cytochrome c [Tistrella bauzanensis]|uniref:Cytochrome c1 n=1 Tax=Tistrella bauzanensis TaxID=657419 RepID=A0ABQ1I8V6_9PROT|nr:cytochrome c1 [Tistrella bauzanensis]GGB24030.1 cytochrome c [Tistrella bauzanensis]